MNNFNYIKLPPFKWFILENFPFIEADFDALTNWQLFCKLGKEINKIINSENTLGTQMENLTNAFIELQNYVTNYFDTLDVQDEINNKLDEMAESGELAEIISQYLQLQITFTYNTVAEMVNAENLVEGSFVQTLGFYSLNDGGKSKYFIREIRNTDVVDNMFIFAITNSEDLIAEKITETELNIKSIGAFGDGTNDDTEVLETAFNKQQVVYMPNGEYLLTDNITIEHPVTVIGENKYNTKIVIDDNITSNITSFISSNEINNIILKNFSLIGGEQTIARHILSLIDCEDLTLKDLYFTGGLGYATRLNNSNKILIQNCDFKNIRGVDGNPRGCNLWTKLVKYYNRQLQM